MSLKKTAVIITLSCLVERLHPMATHADRTINGSQSSASHCRACGFLLSVIMPEVHVKGVWFHSHSPVTSSLTFNKAIAFIVTWSQVCQIFIVRFQRNVSIDFSLTEYFLQVSFSLKWINVIALLFLR